jgi:hypothetical protein
MQYLVTKTYDWGYPQRALIIKKNTDYIDEGLNAYEIRYLFKHLSDAENSDTIEDFLWDNDPLDGNYHETIQVYSVTNGIVESETDPGLSVTSFLKNW